MTSKIIWVETDDVMHTWPSGPTLVMPRFDSDVPIVKLFVDEACQFASPECTVAYQSPVGLAIVALAITCAPGVPPVATQIELPAAINWTPRVSRARMAPALLAGVIAVAGRTPVTSKIMWVETDAVMHTVPPTPIRVKVRFGNDAPLLKLFVDVPCQFE